MKLSEVCVMRPSLKLVVDGEFNALGMATTKYNEESVLSFIEKPAFINSVLDNPNITCVICNESVFEEIVFPENLGIVISSAPRLDFYQLHNLLAETDFYWERFENKIHPTANIHPTAVLYDHSIEIGKNCLIEANVVIHPGTIIGDNCVIRSGSQISTSGFQFLNTGDEIISVISGGRVILEDYVEIQHLNCIDKGVFGGDTILQKYVKTDNLVQIAHDDVIGARTRIAAGTIFGGRTVLGDDCWAGLNTTITNGIIIGDNAYASLGSVVTRDVPEGSKVTGNFAIDHDKFLDHLKKIR